MELFIHGIGVCAPGLPDWPETCEVLLQNKSYSERPLPKPEPTFLPPNELRRSSDVVKWSLHVAQEALQYGKIKASEVATVFASSGGELEILHQLCLALAKPEPIISPTLFHHSVHNAASGYWTIGVESQQPSVSLACFDSSFCGGLLETATVLQVEHVPVLLVVYDLPPPPPLDALALDGVDVSRLHQQSHLRLGRPQTAWQYTQMEHAGFASPQLDTAMGIRRPEMSHVVLGGRAQYIDALDVRYGLSAGVNEPQR